MPVGINSNDLDINPRLIHLRNAIRRVMWVQQGAQTRFVFAAYMCLHQFPRLCDIHVGVHSHSSNAAASHGHFTAFSPT
jgi:hypothetical protein